MFEGFGIDHSSLARDLKNVAVIIQLNYISFALLIDKFDVKMSTFRKSTKGVIKNNV